AAERRVFARTPDLLNLVGVLRATTVKSVQISETMRVVGGFDAEGVCEIDGSVIIRRTALKDLRSYAAVLLHEVGHAASRASDVTQRFETELTAMLGVTAAAALNEGQQEASPPARV